MFSNLTKYGVGGIFIALMVLGAGCNSSPKNTPNTQPTPITSTTEKLPATNQTPTTTAPTKTTPSKIIETGYTTNGDMQYGFTGFTSPTGVVYTMPSQVASLLSGDEYAYTITSKIHPIDPANSNVIYLSASGNMHADTTDKIFADAYIYQYNLKTKELKEVFVEKNRSTSLSIVAREGTKIILSDSNFRNENSPGPCTSYWTMTSFKYFDLANQKKGLQDYQVPAEKLAAEKQKEQKCEASDVKELM